MYVCMYVCMCVCVYVCMYVYMYVSTYVRKSVRPFVHPSTYLPTYLPTKYLIRVSIEKHSPIRYTLTNRTWITAASTKIVFIVVHIRFEDNQQHFRNCSSFYASLEGLLEIIANVNSASAFERRVEDVYILCLAHTVCQFSNY